MLNNEELMTEWKKDCEIDRTSLMSTMYSHPMLHSKYLTYLQTYKLQMRKYMVKYANMKSLKIRYFCGELTKEQLDEYGWKQYLFRKPIKSEMESLLDADTDLQALQEKSLYIEGLIQACESIMKDINSRYFLFKNLVEFTKFEAGV